MELLAPDYQLEDFFKFKPINLSIRGRSNDFYYYGPMVSIYIETKKYILKTASSITEIQDAFRLRYKIFLKKGFLDFPWNIDCDQFDSLCDHLVIIDKDKNEVCGTYRILNSSRSSQFYSQTEFHLESFLKVSGEKIELGRACISKKHRNGQVIDLLWKGIGLYMKKTKAKYLFGCSSIMTEDIVKISLLQKHFSDNGIVKKDFNINPYQCPEIDKNILIDSTDNVESFVPPLLRMYLKAGANIYGQPSHDPKFRCIDYFTVLDIDNVTDSFKKRYFKEGV